MRFNEDGKIANFNETVFAHFKKRVNELFFIKNMVLEEMK